MMTDRLEITSGHAAKWDHPHPLYTLIRVNAAQAHLAQQLKHKWTTEYDQEPTFFYEVLRVVDNLLMTKYCQLLEWAGAIRSFGLYEDDNEILLEDFKLAVEVHDDNRMFVPYVVQRLDLGGTSGYQSTDYQYTVERCFWNTRSIVSDERFKVVLNFLVGCKIVGRKYNTIAKLVDDLSPWLTDLKNTLGKDQWNGGIECYQKLADIVALYNLSRSVAALHYNYVLEEPIPGYLNLYIDVVRGTVTDDASDGNKVKANVGKKAGAIIFRLLRDAGGIRSNMKLGEIHAAAENLTGYSAKQYGKLIQGSDRSISDNVEFTLPDINEARRALREMLNQLDEVAHDLGAGRH